ncbi:MAG: DUF3054 domain-containing protein [Actinobacteria bacterium]|nr:DUF3054 domain-containing protein [Actinomycetota bacterium]
MTDSTNTPSSNWARYAPRSVAPALLDLFGIVTFILVGARQHSISDGAGWFFMVLWPLATGWYLVAIATRLYAATDRMWTRLVITWVAGTLVASVLRGSFTDRPMFSIFTVIFMAWMVLIAFGWRGIARVLALRKQRRRRTKKN